MSRWTVSGEKAGRQTATYSAVRARSAVTHPFATTRDDRLARRHVHNSVLMLDAKHPVEHEGVLVELGALAGLDPARRTPHPGNADLGVTGIDATDKLFDLLGSVARRLDDGRARDVLGHISP